MPADGQICDVLIVGAGPAGLAAAIALRERGVARVCVLDREAEAGGVPRHAAHPGFGMLDLGRFLTGPRYAARYVRRAEDVGVEIRTAITATEWCGPTAVRTTSPDGIVEIAAGAVILATGCRERPRSARLVPGSRPLGVLTTGLLQQLVYVHHERPGRRAMVVGAEHVSFSAVLTLAHAGAKTVAIVTEHRREQTHAPFKWLSATRLGVPILTRSRVAEIIGARRVEAVEIEDLHTYGRRRMECDTVVFTGDWIPDHELARRGGLTLDPGTRGPLVDLALRTSRPGVFAAGNLLHGAERADVAALSGRHAANSVCAFLRSEKWMTRAPVTVACEAPVRWISPNAIGGRGVGAPRGRFVARVDRFCGRGDLVVTQDGRELWRGHYRRLVPNLPIHLSARWAEAVDLDGGEVRVSFDDGASPAERGRHRFAGEDSLHAGGRSIQSSRE